MKEREDQKDETEGDRRDNVEDEESEIEERKSDTYLESKKD